MKKTIILLCAIVLSVFIIIFNVSGCSRQENEQAEALTPETVTSESVPAEALQSESFDLELPLSKGVLSVQVKIPTAWIRNPDFGAVVFQPKNKDDFFYPPLIQFETACSGPCEPAAIPANIEKAIKDIKDTLTKPNINSGDPEFDAVRAKVDILLEERTEKGGWLLAAAVTYSEDLSSSLYVPKFVVHGFHYRTGDDFYIHTAAHGPIGQQDALLALLTKACRLTGY